MSRSKDRLKTLGPIRLTVVHSTRISPHVQRITVTGSDLARFIWQGFDQWAYLVFPAPNGDIGVLPHKFHLGSYMRMLFTRTRHERPAVRSYTLCAWRPETLELDIDFELHGDTGYGAPWAQGCKPGDQLAMYDQGILFNPGTAQNILIVADLSAVPAALGILRDLPDDARGLALLIVPSPADVQEVRAPQGIGVRWLVESDVRARREALLAQCSTEDVTFRDHYAFIAGEATLVTGVRRFLVTERVWPKDRVTFTGYWKMRKSEV